MRLVLRVLFVEFALSWAMVLAGSAHAAGQVWPVAARSLKTRLRSRRCRAGLVLAVAIPAVAARLTADK